MGGTNIWLAESNLAVGIQRQNKASVHEGLQNACEIQ